MNAETFSKRYRQGQHEQVWTALLALGEKVRAEPYLAQAQAVARETMARAATNVGRIFNRLQEVGFHFALPDLAYNPPPDKIPHQLAELEELAGPLPLSLRAWYEAVGSVCFMGEYPDVAAYAAGPFSQAPDLYSDPLVVFPLDYALSAVRDRFEDGAGEILLPVAPDVYHKANVSGGAPYEIRLPDTAADARLLNEPHELFFVPYLRLAFQWAGFPGLAGAPDRPSTLIDLLASKLLTL